LKNGDKRILHDFEQEPDEIKNMVLEGNVEKFADFLGDHSGAQIFQMWR